MIYHYCRVSTTDQNLDRQYAALKEFKEADYVFADKASGKNFDRCEYQRMKGQIQSGDELIVKELDRFGRSKSDIKTELEWFKDHGVTVRILDLPTTLIDFHGQDWVKDMLNNILVEVLGAIAEQERIKIHNRMMEGIAAKKAKGEWDDYGRPEKKIDLDRLKELAKEQRAGVKTVTECCVELGISKGTWYNKLKEIA